MTEKRSKGCKGWAGQWDRHRWDVEVANPPPDRQPARRLRSLDEFTPLPWHRMSQTAEERRAETLRFSKACRTPSSRLFDKRQPSERTGAKLSPKELACMLTAGVSLGIIAALLL